MSLAEWDPALANGDQTIDDQHQKLFEMVNALHDAIVSGRSREILAGTLEKLGAYTLEHFRAEEALMARVGYPELAEHRSRHDMLAKRAAELIEGFRTGKVVLAMTLSRFLADWLRHHIREEDRRMVDWIHGRR